MNPLKDTLDQSKIILHEDTLTLQYQSHDGTVLSERYRFKKKPTS